MTATEDGSLKAEGWKWEQGDWKAGCDYEINGRMVDGAFRSEEKRKNPDTLERDHASLVVNRQDDVFAKKRDGTDDAPTSRNAGATSRTRRPRGCFPPARRPTSTISAGAIR